jgi:hypothetical protein
MSIKIWRCNFFTIIMHSPLYHIHEKADQDGVGGLLQTKMMRACVKRKRELPKQMSLISKAEL